MTKKSWLSGFGYFLGAGVLVTGLAATGCDDDETPSVDAGGAVDAGIDAMSEIDAGCDGHGCAPGADNPWNLDGENGEIRIELYQLEGGATNLAAHAVFFNGQEPIGRPLLGEPIASDVTGLDCFDLTDGLRFNNGVSSQAQAVVDTRNYLEFGDFVNLVNKDDNTDVIALPKEMGEIDLSQNLQHDIIYLADNTLLPKFNVGYDVVFDGLGPSLTDGTAVQQNFTTDDVEVYFPADFTLTNPEDGAYFADGVSFTRGEDFTFAWDNAAVENPNGPKNVVFIGFLSDTFQVESYCFKPVNDGELTIPGETHAVLSADTGVFIMGMVNHVGYTGPDDGRFDTLGVNCKLASYEITDP